MSKKSKSVPKVFIIGTYNERDLDTLESQGYEVLNERNKDLIREADYIYVGKYSLKSIEYYGQREVAKALDKPIVPLTGLIEDKRQKEYMEQILKDVADISKVPVEWICSSKRTPPMLNIIRGMLIYIWRNIYPNGMIKASYSSIKTFLGRDHATSMYLMRLFTDQIKYYKEPQQLFEAFKQKRPDLFDGNGNDSTDII